MPDIKYKRILLKLSGEAIGGQEGKGVDAETLGKICDQVKNVVDLGVEVAIVVTNILLYVPDLEKYDKENGLNIDIFKEFQNCASKDMKDLIRIIEDDSYDINILKRFRKKFISNLKGTSTELICELIIKCLNNKNEVNIKELEDSYKTEVNLIYE